MDNVYQSVLKLPFGRILTIPNRRRKKISILAKDRPLKDDLLSCNHGGYVKKNYPHRAKIMDTIFSVWPKQLAGYVLFTLQENNSIAHTAMRKG